MAVLYSFCYRLRIGGRSFEIGFQLPLGREVLLGPVDIGVSDARRLTQGPGRIGQMGPSQDRKSVVSGKSVSVRVDLGGRRSIKKKNIDQSICDVYLIILS